MTTTMMIEYGLKKAGMGLAILAALAISAGVVTGQGVDTTELRTTQPLTDNWRFVQDDSLTDDEALASTAADWQTVSLPHTWNAQDAATPDSPGYKRGLGWYRLEFATPAAGVRHWIEVGAASLVADVWLNGQKLGQHKGGFTQFRFDVTDVLVASGANVLLVKVDNSIPNVPDDVTAIAPLGGDWNKSGGLYRHVSLVSTAEAAHFDLGDLGGPGIYAAMTSMSGGSATVHVRAKLKNDAGQSGAFIVRASLLDAAGQPAAAVEQTVSLEAGGALEVAQDLNVANAHLWHGRADPYLYQLVADLLRSDGAPIDRVVQRVGIRQMHFDAEQGFFLNGQPLRLNGVAMHQDSLGKGWALSNEDIDASLAFFIEIGANAIRLGHYPFSAYALQRVSELGLIAWAESPTGLRTNVDECTPSDPTADFVANAKQQTQELIRQQYNHAAIALWAVGNETSAGQLGCDEPYDDVTPLLRELHALAKQEDPIRPTVYAEFPHPVERSGPFATEGITDLFATNRYFGWYQEPIDDLGPLLDDLYALVTPQPLGVSEYGAGSAINHHTDNPLGGLPEVHSADDEDPSSFQSEEYASYVHEENYRIISSKPYLWGAFVWNMFDFSSTNRNEGGVLGINTKGLVTFDRQTRKDPFFFYKANWSSEPVTYITSRRYTDRAYAVADVKVYSNADAVQLSVNGTPVGALTAAQCEQRTCVFENVALSPGVNTVTAFGNHGGALVRDTVEWALNTSDVNIAAGYLATGYVSSNGTRFGSDDFFVGGTGGQIGSGDAEGGIPEDIRGTDDPQLYKYFRRGDFSYDIPLPDGSYDMTLGFLEPDEDVVVGERVFDVIANGQPLLRTFDVLQEAGAARTAVTRTFPVDVAGGRLVLEFDPVGGEALVSTIKIIRRQ